MVLGKGTTLVNELKLETAVFFGGCADNGSNEECDYSEDAIATFVVLQLAGVACAKAAQLVGKPFKINGQYGMR